MLMRMHLRRLHFLDTRIGMCFKVECEIAVFHNDRELEYFLVLDVLEREIIPFVTLKANLGSCEQIGERILEGLITAYGDDRPYKITVSEDGENGASTCWHGS